MSEIEFRLGISGWSGSGVIGSRCCHSSVSFSITFAVFSSLGLFHAIVIVAAMGDVASTVPEIRQ